MESLTDRYGLSKKTQLEFIGPDHIAIVRFVSRRLVLNDAEQLLAVANAIHEKDPAMKVSLLCSDNICSKLVAKLSEANIEVLIGEAE